MGFNIVPAPILHIKYAPSYCFLHSNFQINIYNINNENSKIYNIYFSLGLNENIAYILPFIKNN